MHRQLDEHPAPLPSSQQQQQQQQAAGVPPMSAGRTPAVNIASQPPAGPACCCQQGRPQSACSEGSSLPPHTALTSKSRRPCSRCTRANRASTCSGAEQAAVSRPAERSKGQKGVAIAGWAVPPLWPAEKAAGQRTGTRLCRGIAPGSLRWPPM